MNKDISFFVSGIPASKGSLNKGKQGQLYPADPKLKKWALIIGWLARKWAPGQPTRQPIELNLLFYLPMAGTTPGAYHTQKPDIDKLTRAVMDALTGIIYNDDSQVWQIHAGKVHSDNPGVKITVGYW